MLRRVIEVRFMRQHKAGIRIGPTLNGAGLAIPLARVLLPDLSDRSCDRLVGAHDLRRNNQFELLQTIPVTVDRRQSPAVCWKQAQLAADAADMRIQGARIELLRHAPDAFAYMPAGQQPPNVS